jgi:hypothetical protein
MTREYTRPVRKLVPPIVWSSITIALVGILIGYVGTAFAGTLVADSGLLPGSTGEQPAARQYVVKMLQHETDSLAQLRPQQDVISRALEQQNAESQRQQTASAKPMSVTYLGGASSGRFSVQIYAVEVRGANGRTQFFPLALTLAGGKVVRVD